MGHRTAKRVPLDFDWPLKEVWTGYLPPKWRPCPSDDCSNGYTLAGAWLNTMTQLLLMLGSDTIEARKNRPLHPWLEAVPCRPPGRPGPQIADLTGALAGRAPSDPFGHDSSDAWNAAKAIVKAAGLPEDWDICPICRGNSVHPDDLEARDAWEGTDPPVGDGWQLWETTSEGSPVSPVFGSAEELAEWCGPNATWFAAEKMPAADWLRGFLNDTTDVDTLLILKTPRD